MEFQMAEWKAQREQEQSELRSKSPIAALFEDCSQLLNRLCSTLYACATAGQITRLAEDCEVKLKIWGHDSGAESRGLDHRLRHSVSLKEAVLQLLEELRGVLLEVVDETQPQFADDSKSQGSTTHEDEESSGDSYLEDDIDSDTDRGKYIDDATELVNCLRELLPELQRPARDYFKVGTEDSSAMDLQIAVEMFPAAPDFLRRRIASANSMRRQRLKATGSWVVESPAGREAGMPHHARKVGASQADHSNFRRSGRSFWRRRRKRAGSETGISTMASTTMETVFSTGVFSSMLGTSVAETQPPQTVYLKPPEPPAELKDGASFTCPYCLFELPLDLQNMSHSDWIEHVYLDLEPYICTYDNCSHSHTTYGRREEWFNHETCEHRSRKVWVCHSPLCDKEFSTEAHFHDHLLVAHSELFQGSNLSAIIDAFKGLSPVSMKTYLCPLCQIPLSNTSKLKDHVANHLEQFSLSTICYADSSDDEDSDTGLDMEGDIAEQPGELLLGRFVAEQASSAEKAENKVTGHSRLALEKLQSPTSDTDAASVCTVSSSDMADNGQDSPPRKGKDDWENRVNVFLESKEATEEKSGVRNDANDVVCFNRPARHSEFVGRKEGLDRLHSVLGKPGQICLMSGRGGIGKTSTAIEYSYKYESDYSLIFWIEAETAGGCADKYAGIASSVGVGDLSRHEQASLINLTKDYLSKTERRFLLIFDNVEDWDDISRYIPRNMPKTSGSVLITAREASIWAKISKYYFHVNLNVLPVEDCTSLLLSSITQTSRDQDWTKHHDYELAAEASKLVGQLPLAIAMVAGYVKVSRCTLDEFLETWEEREEVSKKNKQNKLISKGALDASIDALWDIGIGELSVKARSLLDILSFLAPDAIQKDLLVGDHSEEALQFLNSAETIRYRRMIDQLHGRKLITVKTLRDGSEMYSIHRLLQTKILADIDSYKMGETFGYKFGETFQSALSLVSKRYPPASASQIPEPSKWGDCEKYMLHVSSLHRVYLEYNPNHRIKPTLELAQLFYNAGFHVWERRTTAYNGLSFLLCAEEILEEMEFDNEGKLRADIHSIAGIFYNEAGSEHRDESIRREKAAYNIRQMIQNKSPDDRDNNVLLCNAASNLAVTLLNKNEFEEAGQLVEDCLKRYKEWGTEDDIPFEYAKYYNCQGFVQMRRGNYAEATKHFEKCVALAAKHSTQTWQYWQYNFSLACVLHQSGEAQKALEAHLHTLNGRLDAFGKHDQNTIFSTYAVGSMYHHMKDLPTATDYMIECVDSAKSARVPKEALGRAQYHLSQILREQEIEEGEAQKLEANGLRILDEFSQYASKFLKGSNDKMAMFDDLQPIFDGRFTGQMLLTYMQGV